MIKTRNEEKKLEENYNMCIWREAEAEALPVYNTTC